MLKMIEVVVIALLCCAHVLAQRPARCVSPAAWQGRVLEVNPAKRYERYSIVTYDSIQERIAIRDEIVEEEKREFYEEIFLHRKKVGYKINRETRHCTKFALLEPFQPVEVPPNATSRGEVYVGTSSIVGASTPVTLWTADTVKGRYSGSWTVVDCVPVTDTYSSATGGYYIHKSFYDVVVGIPDPDVFIPPSECF